MPSSRQHNFTTSKFVFVQKSFSIYLTKVTLSFKIFTFGYECSFLSNKAHISVSFLNFPSPPWVMNSAKTFFRNFFIDNEWSSSAFSAVLIALCQLKLRSFCFSLSSSSWLLSGSILAFFGIPESSKVDYKWCSTIHIFGAFIKLSNKRHFKDF